MSHGRAGAWAQRGLVAMALAIGLAGCASVERDQYSREYLDDSVITAKVKTRLTQELGSPAVGISVDTLNKVVILSGFVETQEIRDKAIAAARSVGGVRDVKGENLVLRPERRGS
jgi:osmotically-inducible protein OsmY